MRLELVLLIYRLRTDILNNAINEPGWFILDVRYPNELERDGSIKATNWANIPEASVEEKISQIPNNVKIVVHCKSGSNGGRSSRAAELLKSKGYDAEFYPGGYFKWKDIFTATTLPL